MFFLSLFTFASGYLFNEESSLTRICRRRDLLPLGWFVLKEANSLWYFVVAGLLAFLKGYVWARVLNLYLLTDYNLVFGLLYLAGNFLAAKRASELSFTTPLGALALLWVFAGSVFQVTLTAICVTWLFSRNFESCLLSGRVASCLAFFAGGSWFEFFSWTSFVLAAQIFYHVQSLFGIDLIKYSGRNLRWRVTL